MSERNARPRKTKAVVITLVLCLVAVASIGLLAKRKILEPHLFMDCSLVGKQFSLCCKMYAHDNDGFWPPLALHRGRLAPVTESLFPKYYEDSIWFDCVAKRKGRQTQLFDDGSYLYLDYGLKTKEDVLLFVDSYRRFFESGETKWPESFSDETGTHHIYRLGSPQETTAPEKIPVLIERPGNHSAGCNVTFLDGHIESWPYPGPFPLAPDVMELLVALADEDGPPQ